MKIAFLPVAVSLFVSVAAHAEGPKIVSPESLAFAGPPQIPALSAAWAIGSEKGGGMYALRVKLKTGGVIPPHTHPDTRVTTVLAGAVSVGYGGVVDRSKTVSARVGDTYEIPAGVVHFLMAPEGDTEYQELGCGATGTEMVKR